MYISGALKNLDNSLNEAAESLGCTAFQRVTQIIVPLVMPTMLASSLLVFMRVFSDFGTPMLIGEGYKTFPVLIYSQFMGEVSTDDHFAAALCVIVIGITLGSVLPPALSGQPLHLFHDRLKAHGGGKMHRHPQHPVPPVRVRGGAHRHPATDYGHLHILPGNRRRNGIHRGLFPGNYRNTLFSKNNNTAIFDTLLFGIAPSPSWWCLVSSYPI